MHIQVDKENIFNKYFISAEYYRIAWWFGIARSRKQVVWIKALLNAHTHTQVHINRYTSNNHSYA